MRMLCQPLLDDPAADRVPDKNWPFCVYLLQKILQRVRQRCDTGIRKRSRPAIARHIPGHGTISVAKARHLAAPGPRRTSNAMQEDQRRLSGIAGGLIA